MDVVSDPWLVSSSDCDINVTAFEDDFKPYERMPDSVSYIHSLENKLAKIKGRKDQLTGQKMLESFDKARDDLMSHLLKDLSSPAHCFEDVSVLVTGSVTKEGSLQSLIKTKLCPEKQAISEEELLKLIAADQLALTAAADRSSEDVREPAEHASRKQAEETRNGHEK